MSPQPPDFNRLLADGREHDASGFRSGCVATVRILRGDRLRLPTGRLVAAEPPGNFPDGAQRCAFTHAVPPGDYPVELVMADYTDPGNPQGNTAYDAVAAARVVVRAEPVNAWRLALCDGQDEADLAEGHIYAYPVDGGIGAFGSPEVFDVLGRNEEAREDLLVDASFGSDEPYVTYTDEATGNNLVLFRSGNGDGRYATWVGYTAEGEVACFLTDFGLLT
ncbi:hypothetical protein GCM10023322_54140 [Rugosimonospora acidiphila]|uniref:DUF4241 domain-containing protein n=1 Tax=Rugosimonospora acidiphila TaxID=556531 RepID=A0ABP9SBG4_9ACTN